VSPELTRACHNIFNKPIHWVGKEIFENAPRSKAIHDCESSITDSSRTLSEFTPGWSVRSKFFRGLGFGSSGFDIFEHILVVRGLGFDFFDWGLEKEIRTVVGIKSYSK